MATNGVNNTNTTEPPSSQLPTHQTTLRHLSRLVQLCNITVTTLDSYLQIMKLVKEVETEAAHDLTALQGSRQFSLLAVVLHDVVDALEEMQTQLNRTALLEDCGEVGALTALWHAVDSIPEVVQLVKTHSREGWEANLDGRLLPGLDMLVIVRSTYVKLLALQRWDVENVYAPWENCVTAVTTLLERNGLQR